MKILGIDPGLVRLGIAATEFKDQNLSLITYGLINNPRKDTDSYNQHLNSGIYQIVNEIPRLIDLIRPNIICAELVPPGRLGSSSDTVMAAVTVCKIIAYQFGIQWVDIAASTVKKEFTGNYKASKAVVKNEVFATFPIVKDRHAALKKEQKEEGITASGLPQDVFDAIAIAVVGIKLHGQINTKVSP